MKTPILIRFLVAVPLLSIGPQCARADAMIIDFEASNIPENSGSPGAGWNPIRTPDFQSPSGSPTWSSPQRYDFGTSYFFNTAQFDPTNPNDPLSQLNFFGGFQRIYGSGNPTGGNQNLGGSFLLDDDPDRLILGASGGNTTVEKIEDGLFLWGESQFMNGGNTMGVAFDDTSTIRINKSLSSGGAPLTSSELRFVVNNGGVYYISEFNLTGATEDSTLTDFNNNNAAGKRWSVFTPTTIDFDLPDSYTFEAVDFNDVQSVGFLFNGTNDGYENFELVEFEVVGSVVPEPNALLLFCMGATVLVCLRRHR